MNTDDLIDFLSTHVEAVDPSQQDRLVILGMLGSFATAGILAVLTLGIRADMAGAMATPGFLMKIGFLASAVAVGVWGLRRAARAGGLERRVLRVALVPLALVWFAAGAELAMLPRPAWYGTIMFREWSLCVVAIPLLSIVPLLLLTLIVRAAAPTALPYCGALLGLVAGGIGGLAYAAYCLNDTPVYVGVWYAAGVAIVTVAGWVLGPRLLRW